MTAKAEAPRAEPPGISPVAQAAPGGQGLRPFAVLAGSVVVVLAVGWLVFSHWLAQHRQTKSERPDGTEATTASAAGAVLRRAGTGPADAVASAVRAPGPQPGRVPAAPLPGVFGGSGAQNPAFDPARDLPELARIAGVRDPAAPVPQLDLGGARMDPAGSRGTGAVVSATSSPFDAPALLLPGPGQAGASRALGAPPAEASLEAGVAQARAHLDQTEARLERLLGGAPAAAPGTAAGADDALKPTSTARIGAAHLVEPSLTLPRGTTFTCALSNRIVSEDAGPVSCVVARNVYGVDGRVLLIERGSHLDGAYQALARVGQSRIAVAWERLRMPDGVVVDLASPATGPLGEAGVDGAVDEHWSQRIGAALLLSLFDDAVNIEIAREQAKGGASGTVLLQGTGAQTSSLAGKVLDSTINIPPTVIKNQGEIVAVRVARDVDFSPVYALRTSGP